MARLGRLVSLRWCRAYVDDLRGDITVVHPACIAPAVVQAGPRAIPLAMRSTLARARPLKLCAPWLGAGSAPAAGRVCSARVGQVRRLR